MMKILSFGLMFFLSFFSIAQTAEKRPLTPAELQQAVEQYKTMYDSKDYQEFMENTMKLNYMMNYIPMTVPVTDLKAVDAWYEENWPRSQFKSLEELKQFRQANLDCIKTIWERNTELQKLMQRATLDEMTLILTPHRIEMEKKYGR